MGKRLATTPRSQVRSALRQLWLRSRERRAALWWGRKHGEYMQTMAWEVERMRDRCIDAGCDQYWIDLFDQTASDMYNVSAEEQGIN